MWRHAMQDMSTPAPPSTTCRRRTADHSSASEGEGRKEVLAWETRLQPRAEKQQKMKESGPPYRQGSTLIAAATSALGVILVADDNDGTDDLPLEFLHPHRDLRRTVLRCPHSTVPQRAAHPTTRMPKDQSIQLRRRADNM